MILFFAMGFYSGKLPHAPGTFGTLAGIPFALILKILPVPWHLVYGVGFVLGAVFLADKAAGILNEKDPGCIVIDEVAGIMISFFLLPITFKVVLTTFFLFRAFDCDGCTYSKYLGT